MPETYGAFVARVYEDGHRAPETFAEWAALIDWTAENGGLHRLNSLNALEHGAGSPLLAARARRYQAEIRAAEEFPDFPWPCDRRDAHGGHDVPVCTCAMTEGSLLTCPAHGEDRWRDTETRWCEGVKAHPGTMIGRAYHRG